MPMNKASQVAKGASFISTAVSTAYMPPWPAGDGDVAFHGDRRLSDEQIRKIVDWANAGAVLDVADDTALVPTRIAYEPIEADVTMVGQPYRGSLVDTDDYHCQVYDPQLSSESYLQGLEVLPDQTAIVHHALVFAVPAQQRQRVQSVDDATAEPGFPCGGLGIGGRMGQLITSWAPGQAPTAFPEDTGVRMSPSDFLVMQIHYHYDAAKLELPPDESALAVDFASAEAIAEGLDPLELTLYLAPAEIPCTDGLVGPLCDRAAAVVDLQTRANALGGFVADGLLAQCGQSATDFATMTTGVVTATCDLPAAPGQVVSLWGHMHELGASYRMVLNPGTDSERVLLDIPKWDFDWQLLYNPVDDIVLAPGDIIRVECTWDRSLHDYGAEPRYILWSEGTADEMCYSQIVTRPQ